MIDGPERAAAKKLAENLSAANDRIKALETMLEEAENLVLSASGHLLSADKESKEKATALAEAEEDAEKYYRKYTTLNDAVTAAIKEAS